MSSQYVDECPPDELDRLMWENQHALKSEHWAWRFYRRFNVDRESWWNWSLFRSAKLLDPPKGQPKARKRDFGTWTMPVIRAEDYNVPYRDVVTLERLVYARLMHLAYAGANLLAEPNGQTDVEPYPVNKAWLDQIDKEAR